MGWIKSHWTVFNVIVLLLSGAWIGLTAAFLPAPELSDKPAPRIGHPAPDLELATLDGAQLSLADQKGKVVLINFWASWCPPCKAEMPAIQQISQSYAGEPVVVLSINATDQDDLTTVKEFVETYALTFPILLDVEGNASDAFRVQALPTTFFIDKFGMIQKIIYGGPLSEALLRTEIDRLLKEKP